MYRYERSDQSSVASAINFVAGLWLIFSAWVFAAPTADPGMRNSIVVGIVVAVFALFRLVGGVDLRPLSWINAVLGAWMIFSPSIYGYAGQSGRASNSIVVGIIILVLAIAAAAADLGWQPAQSSADRWRYAGAWDAPERRYRGVGPKGYRRSDDQIRDDVCLRMTEEPGLDPSDIEVRVVASDVILQGTVPTRAARRLAEDVAESVAGVREVNNQLRTRTRAVAESPRKIA